MKSTQTYNPNLDGLGLPEPLTFAIRTAFKYIYELRDAAPTQLAGVPTTGDLVLLVNTHAQRLSNFPAASFAIGSLFVETDRTLVYQVQTVSAANQWVYLSGKYPRTQAQLAALAATLTANDTGLLVPVTNHNHVLQWNGTTWQFAPGDGQGGFVQGFLVDPDPTTGWHLCDGTANVPYLKKDGTLGTQTLPDLVSAANKAAYFKLGSPASATVNAATAPALTMNSYTPAGTVSAPVFTGNALTPSGTNSAPTFTGNSATPTGTISAIAATASAAAVVTVGAVSVASQTHTHPAPTFTGNAATPTGSVSAPTFTGNAVTPTGTNSAPTFTGTPAVLTGTIDTTGQPQNIVLRPWFRQ